MEGEWPAAHKRALNLRPPIPSRSYEHLLSSWWRFQSGSLELINRRETFTPGVPWEHFHDSTLPPLVVETFHYHQYLAEFGELLICPETDEALRGEILASLTSLLDGWWELYPVGQLPAWGAFAMAFRVRSWLWLHRLLTGCPDFQARLLEKRLEKRAFIHGLYLERNLERHLGGNHLFKDLCAMAMLASFFEGPAASRWFALVERELPLQLEIQILPDGGHYERSPMYQCLVLSDLLDAAEYLLGWNSSWVKDNLLDPIHRMTNFLTGILHPDGEIPLFNDSVFGQSAPAGKLLKRVEVLFPSSGEWTQPDSTLTTFPSTGITRLHHGGLTCIIDHGRLGPDELMGHVHNDTLSFELSVDNERFMVDKGVYEYTSGPRRSECRSIHSHNTPSVDGFEQAETWASFRVARRWHIKTAKVTGDPSGISVQGEWERPRMKWIGRTVTCDPGGSLIIRDEIRCNQTRTCQIPFLFAPGIQVNVIRSQQECFLWHWEARSENRHLCGWIESTSPARVSVEDTVSWPRFYMEFPSSRILIRAEVQTHIVVFNYLATSWDAFKGLPALKGIYLSESGSR